MLCEIYRVFVRGEGYPPLPPESVELEAEAEDGDGEMIAEEDGDGE